jgi:tetratricopeptide (TPR) repeat protein
VQEEIARSIVQTLKGRLVGEEEKLQVREATTDPEAYKLFLKGRHFYNRFAAIDYRKALALFEQATEKDPGFARAWAWIAQCWSSLSYLGGVPAAKALPEARVAVERALALDPQLADGYLARARIAHDTRAFERSERDLQRALELNPASAGAHIMKGVLLTNLCRPEEAIVAYRQAGELDPLWVGPPNNLGLGHMLLGRYTDAVNAFEQALELAPASGPAARNLTIALSRLGRHEEAIARAREVHAREADAGAKSVLALCLLRAGRQSEAEESLAQLEALRAQYNASSWDLVPLYVWMARHDEAFAALEEAIAAEDPGTTQLTSSIFLDPLREDARWEALLSRAGFPPDAIRRSRELHERRRATEEAAPFRTEAPG